jgi:hypothetical protein
MDSDVCRLWCCDHRNSEASWSCTPYRDDGSMRIVCWFASTVFWCVATVYVDMVVSNSVGRYAMHMHFIYGNYYLDCSQEPTKHSETVVA